MESLVIHGNVKWQSKLPNGEVTAEGIGQNTATSIGKSALTITALGRTSSDPSDSNSAAMSHIILSTGTTAPSESDTNLVNTSQLVWLPLDGGSNANGGRAVGEAGALTGRVFAAAAAATGSGLVDGRTYAEAGLVLGIIDVRSSRGPRLALQDSNRLSWSSGQGSTQPFWTSTLTSYYFPTYSYNCCLFARVVWPLADRPQKQAGQTLTVTWQINVA